MYYGEGLVVNSFSIIYYLAHVIFKLRRQINYLSLIFPCADHEAVAISSNGLAFLRFGIFHIRWRVLAVNLKVPVQYVSFLSNLDASLKID